MQHTAPDGQLTHILSYRHPGVCEKLVTECGYTPDAAALLFQDTLRFLAIGGAPTIRTTVKTMARSMGYRVGGRHFCIAPTRAIDEAWHRFVLFTHDYRRFCHRSFGHFLHHQPVANPKLLAQVVRGDHLIRIARHVYGDDLDLTNWRGDSTNSGTCCVGESADCDVCWDSGRHCFACCTCDTCSAFHDRLSAARRAWSETEQHRSAAEHAIERPRWKLQDTIASKQDRCRQCREHIVESRNDLRELEPKVQTCRERIVNRERELTELEDCIPTLKAKLDAVRTAVARERAGAYQDIEASARRAKATYDRLLSEHRTALGGRHERGR